jgi:hypothetical protein
MADAATCCCELKVTRGFRITSLIQHRQSGSAVTTLSVVQVLLDFHLVAEGNMQPGHMCALAIVATYHFSGSRRAVSW